MSKYIIITEFGEVYKTADPLPEELTKAAEYGYLNIIDISDPENPMSFVETGHFEDIHEYNLPADDDED